MLSEESYVENYNFVCVKEQMEANGVTSTEMEAVIAASEGIKNYHVQVINERAFQSTGMIGLDTMAGVSIFRTDMVLNEYQCKPIFIHGVKNGSEPIMVNTKGVSVLGFPVYVSNESVGNILSFADARANSHSVVYDHLEDEFKVQLYEDDAPLIFKRDKFLQESLYVCDLHSHRCQVHVNTVSDNIKAYSKRQVKQAVEARKLQRRLGFVSRKTLIEMLNNGALLNCELTSSDVERAEKIFGQDVGEIKGKSVAAKSPVVNMDEKIHYQVQQRDEVVNCDIMFINKKPFLASVFNDTEYTMLTRLKSRNATEVMKALRKQFYEMKKQGYNIRVLRTDGESGISKDERNVNELASMGIEIDVTGATEAVQKIERKIRTIKERARCALCTLPYALTSKLVDILLMWATNKVNIVPTRNTQEYQSPREKVYHQKINIATDAKHGFGDYVQVMSNDTNSSLAERTKGAIALLPTGNSDGSWIYMTLDNGALVRRRRARALPMPDEVKLHLDKMAMKEDSSADLNKTRLGQSSYRSEIQGITDTDDGIIDSETEVNTDLMSFSQDYFERPADNIYSGELDEEIESAEPENIPTEDHSRLSSKISYDHTDNDDMIQEESTISIEQDYQLAVDIVNEEFMDRDVNSEQAISSIDVDEGTTQVIDVEPGIPLRFGGRDLRVNRAQPGRWAKTKRRSESSAINLVAQVVSNGLQIESKNLSVKKAIAKLGDKAMDSIRKELQMVINDKEVFEPIFPNKLDTQTRRNTIPSKMFLKEKYNAAGKFEKVKARLVAGGHRQDKLVFENISSQTVSTSSVMMVAAIAAAEQRSVAVIDFPGAYLNSPLPSDHPRVYMKLDKDLSSIACEVNPKYIKYIQRDGTLTVLLKKALYGCVQSSKVWYDTLTGKLKELGYEINQQDVCVLNKIGDDGKQVTAVLHVDDIMLTAGCDGSLQSELDKLQKKFGELTITMGPVVNYLGMTFDFESIKGSVKITMEGFIEEFITDMDGKIDGTADHPAAKNLFEVHEKEDILDKEMSEFFHSTVAKLLYLAKRVRPDLLVSVSFLTKRVQQPNKNDYKKLCQVVKYLRGSSKYGIVLDAEKVLQVIAYIDASHAVHLDHKSHTGCVLSLGRGPIYVKSSSQKINTKSSTESELVGLSDSITQVIWTRNFLIEQGYDMGPSTVYQDNMSTMALVKNGKSNSERTKHIATRFYFVKDRVESKELRIVHMRTEYMIADILTKPLQGSLFRELRKLLLNWHE